MEPKAKKAREPASFSLSNPSRMTHSQTRFIGPQPGQRYVPICRQTCPAGLVMLLDRDPTAPETVAKGELDPFSSLLFFFSLFLFVIGMEP